MATSSATSLPRRADRVFRSAVRPEDAEAADKLARASGVFNEGEAGIARELVEDNLVKGADGSGYYFLFADGPGGRLDALACFGPIPATEGRAELYWIDVHPEARRSGLGTEIADAMEEVLRGWNIRYLVCSTSSRDHYAPARNFYRSRGFVQVADIPHWYAEDDGLCIFRKELK